VAGSSAPTTARAVMARQTPATSTSMSPSLRKLRHHVLVSGRPTKITRPSRYAAYWVGVVTVRPERRPLYRMTSVDFDINRCAGDSNSLQTTRFAKVMNSSWSSAATIPRASPNTPDGCRVRPRTAPPRHLTATIIRCASQAAMASRSAVAAANPNTMWRTGPSAGAILGAVECGQRPTSCHRLIP